MAKRNPYYSGPRTDHFDGRVFSNPAAPHPTRFRDFLRWRFATSGRTPWPDSRPLTMADRPPARVEGDRLRVSFVGHATVLLQTEGLNILTDPVWADHAGPKGRFGPKRMTPPGVRFDDLPPIDAVLLSHNHYDHMDLKTLRRLHARDRPRIVTPLGNDTILKRAGVPSEAHDWHDTVDLAPNVATTLHPVQHWSARGLRDRRMALWAGFTLRLPGGNVFFAGDTGFAKGEPFRRAAERDGPFRLALLPIGAYEPRWFMSYAHMNPDEAVEAFRLLRTDYALAIHHGTFRLTDEGPDDPAAALATARARHAIPADRFRALAIGASWEVPPADG